MNSRTPGLIKLITVPALLFAMACNDNGADATAVTATPSAAPELLPAGKPSAPVNIEYKVLGNAIVGQPVAIELRLSSPVGDRPMKLSYFINDADSLMLGESQPGEIDLSIPESDGVAARQVTVIPQREGRLYLNVTVEIETENGAMLKSMAVPIAVGPGGGEAAVNGELRAAPGGETVVSMPALEN